MKTRIYAAPAVKGLTSWYDQIVGLITQLELVCFTFNPFSPEFTSVIFIHYTPRIAVAILDL